MVPVGEGRGLMRWAMVSGMLMVRGEMWACTGFTGDSGASCFSLFSLDRAVNVILMFVLGNLNVHQLGQRFEFPAVHQREPLTFLLGAAYALFVGQTRTPRAQKPWKTAACAGA